MHVKKWAWSDLSIWEAEEDHEFEASLDCIARLYLKINLKILKFFS